MIDIWSCKAPGTNTRSISVQAPARAAEGTSASFQAPCRRRKDSAAVNASPRSVAKAVVLGNARRRLISPVRPKHGSRAAGAFQAHSACWRQFAVVQHIPIGILRLKQIWILSCPQWALGACRAYPGNRHHRCNNKDPESSHGRAPNGCCFRAEHSR